MMTAAAGNGAGKAGMFGTLFAEAVTERWSIPAGRYDRERRMYVETGTGRPTFIRCAGGGCTATSSCDATTSGSANNPDSDSASHTDTDNS